VGFEKEMKSDEALFDFILACPKQNSTLESKVLLREWYETYHGICDHMKEASNEPLAVCSKHLPEDSHDFGMRKLMMDYMEFDIKKFFDLSYIEYCMLPREMTDDMKELILIKMSSQSKEFKAMQEKMGIEK